MLHLLQGYGSFPGREVLVEEDLGGVFDDEFPTEQPFSTTNLWNWLTGDFVDTLLSGANDFSTEATGDVGRGAPAAVVSLFTASEEGG